MVGFIIGCLVYIGYVKGFVALWSSIPLIRKAWVYAIQVEWMVAHDLLQLWIGNRRGYEEGYSYVVSGLDSLSRGRDAAAHKNPEPCGGVWTGEL